jgi:hypothetical protein
VIQTCILATYHFLFSQLHDVREVIVGPRWVCALFRLCALPSFIPGRGPIGGCIHSIRAASTIAARPCFRAAVVGGSSCLARSGLGSTPPPLVCFRSGCSSPATPSSVISCASPGTIVCRPAGSCFTSARPVEVIVCPSCRSPCICFLWEGSARGCVCYVYVGGAPCIVF